MATLDARQQHTIEFRAAGKDVAEALAAIQKLAANHFGDDDTFLKPGSKVDQEARIVTTVPNSRKLKIGRAHV